MLSTEQVDSILDEMRLVVMPEKLLSQLGLVHDVP